MRIYNNFPLSDILYYKIGGKAKFLIEIHNKTDLGEALEFCFKNKIKNILPLGFGSNVLISDNDFNGIVLWFSKPDAEIIRMVAEDIIEAFSSNALDHVIQFSFTNNLSGLEWAGGLPSTVGAAVRGNVGAFGSEIKDAVYKIEAVDSNTGETKVLDNKELQFSYRNSFVKQNKNFIISTVFFKLRKTDKKGLEEAKEVYKENINYRKEHHPIEYPSCGSVFKNIASKDQVKQIIQKWPDVQNLVTTKWHGKASMGYIIKRLGFSNFKIGSAKVSEKHANYIVNLGGAKFSDVMDLIKEIKQKFYKTFDFYPQEEIEIVK